MTEAPDETALKRGLAQATEIYLGETSIAHAVGESGRVVLCVEMLLDRGRSRWIKGAVSFERRIDMGGA